MRARADLRKGRAAHGDHVRNGGDGLGVVDDRGTAIEADDRREGRLDARDAALAFERLHEGRFFADLVCARAGLRDDLKFVSEPKMFFAEEALRVRIGDGLLHDLEEVAVLSAQVDEAQSSRRWRGRR